MSSTSEKYWFYWINTLIYATSWKACTYSREERSALEALEALVICTSGSSSTACQYQKQKLNRKENAWTVIWLRFAQRQRTTSPGSVWVTVTISPSNLSTHIYLEPPAGRVYTIDFINGRRQGRTGHCVHMEEWGVEMHSRETTVWLLLKQIQLLG